MLLQILDADYFLNNNKPVLRVFGKTESGKSVCCIYDRFVPYFYAIPKNGDFESLTMRLGELKLTFQKEEKFLPFGYQEFPSIAMKIWVSNPQDVPKVREAIEKDNDVYDADILFKYRFMVDFNINGMQWFDIECAKTQTKAAKVPTFQLLHISPHEKKGNAPLKYLSIDIECLPLDISRPPDAKKDPIIMVSLAFEPAYQGRKTLVLVGKPSATDEATHSFPSEKSMLERFAQIIDGFDPDIITGYNINNFDVPYVLERLHKHNIPQSFGRCDKPVFSKTFGSSQETIISGRVAVDPYQILKRDTNIRFYRYDLNTVAKAMLGEEKGKVAYRDIPALWGGNPDSMRTLVEYARKDAELALRILLEKKLLDRFFELSKISGVLLQDCLGGQSIRIENMLLREFRKRGILMPVKPAKQELESRMKEKIKGATVLEPRKGLYTNCILVLDFQSLYPSIIKNFNISPDTIDLTGNSKKYHESPTGSRFAHRDIYEGVFPFVLKSLLKERAGVKREMKSASGGERHILDAKQHALKILANSFYGYCGYVRARLYMLAIANTITAYGRENIVKTKQMIEDAFSVEVVYGDTDSLFIDSRTTDVQSAHELGEKISKFVSEKGELLLEFEKVYKTFLILSKKRYAGWKFERLQSKDGSITFKEDIDMKGIETVRRDWCPLVTETMDSTIKTVLKEGDLQKVINNVRDVIFNLNSNNIPLEKLTVVKGITKSVRSYDGVLPHIELAKKIAARSPSNPPQIGDRIGYVIIKGNDLLSRRAEDPEYIKSNNLQIDSEYYINNQLLPPIERILYAVGVERSELVGNGRQVSMFDIFNGIKSRKNKLVGHAHTESSGELMCKKCNKIYRRIPLRGLCECGGEFF